MHEGHQRDQLRCCLHSGLICSVDIIIVLRFAKRSEDHLDYTPISHDSLSNSCRAHQFNLFMLYYKGIQVSISQVFNVMFSAMV